MKHFLYVLTICVLSTHVSVGQLTGSSTNVSVNAVKPRLSIDTEVAGYPFIKSALKLSLVDQRGIKTSIQTTDFKLKEVNPKTDAYGYQHYHYTQTINGIEVDGAEMRVHVKNGITEDQNGSWLLDVPARLTTLRASQPTQAILGTVESSLKGQKINSHDLTVSSANGRTATDVPDGAKLVYVPIGKDLENISPDSVRLAYRFTVRTGALGRWMYYVDATNGELLYKIDMVCRMMGNRQHQHTAACSPEAMSTAQPQAVAPPITETNDPGSRLFTQYSGSRTANTTKQSDGNWSLKDLKRNIEVLQLEGVKTDDNGAISSVKSAPYLNSSNQWRSSSPTDLDGYATDALWAAQQTYDFYQQTFGEWKYSTSNPNQKVNVYTNVNFDKYVPGITNDNAFYDGDNLYVGVGYLAKGILPQSALDIVAHELAHGITAGFVILMRVEP